MILAAKCSPDSEILKKIEDAGITGVELFLSSLIMKDPDTVVSTAIRFPFRYAIHAPNDYYDPAGLLALAQGLGAEIVVVHDVYWPEEWRELVSAFEDSPSRLCVENVTSIIETWKTVRRYGVGRCLDLEHLQMECLGVFSDEFRKAMALASHVHMTGYRVGSDRWHTHLHHDPQHCRVLLEMLFHSGYLGMVVSEARECYQNCDEFLRLANYFRDCMVNLRQECRGG